MLLIAALLVLGVRVSVVTAAVSAVFAHFMVTNTGAYTSSDWITDITAAKAAGIDGFALNVQAKDPANSQLNTAFSVANSAGFKLFFSFDYAANVAWTQGDVISLLGNYTGNAAYYRRGGVKPLASTFEGPYQAGDWTAIKEATGVFFIPDWSSKVSGFRIQWLQYFHKKNREATGENVFHGAQAALKLSPGVPDGLFSWAGWPTGARDMDTYTDASYMQFLSQASLSTYMMPVSPWFYTNLPGFNKNWLWRGDDLWFDRWTQVLFLTQIQKDLPAPEFVEIISWNDYGESHYIGGVNQKALSAFTIGDANFNYASGVPHDGWRQFLPFLIQLAKTGKATVGNQGVVMWSRRSPADPCDNYGTVANTASQLQIEMLPWEVIADKIFYSALLGASATVTVTVGGVNLNAGWTDVPAGGAGIYHGSVSFSGHTGTVVVTVNGLPSVSGTIPITNDCTPDQYNAYVYASTGASSSAVVDISHYVCVEGWGVNAFANICKFACGLGYCPIGACVCSKIGPQPTMPKSLNKNGYPTNGDQNYLGLCSFSVNYGYTGSECSTKQPASYFIPAHSPFFPDTATAGEGTGPDSESMCQFSCKYGYCPLYDCEITATGPLVPPPDPTMPLSSFATNLLPPGKNLCAFACARGVCNTGYCYPQPTHTPTPTETAKPTTTDWTTLDPSQVIVVYSDTNCQNPIAGYGCQEIRNSCVKMPADVWSYQIVKSIQAQATCPQGGNAVFNSFRLYTDSSCDGLYSNAGGGSAGCAENGCLHTFSNDYSFPAVASTYIQCSPDFTCVDGC